MRHLAEISLHLATALLLCGCAWAQADQFDQPEVPLGDVARSMRKVPTSTAPKTVIDNDNFDKMMEEAETHHPGPSTMLFSFDPDGKTFRVSPTPDVTCSLSFNAQATSLISDPYLSREMPASEIAKLSGPAAIRGDNLQVSVFNGSTWRLDEITVGLTIVRKSASASYYGSARLIPAASETVDTSQKAPDTTTLYKMRAAAAPAAVTVFTTDLQVPLGPDEEWHWAIVQAKGIPPRPGTPEAVGPADFPVIPQTAKQVQK